MTDYVTPTTWEQCAAHVEAGGVVEIEDAPGVWISDRAATTIYRGRCGTPDDGWAPRRLVPIESAAPANGVPDVPTGAERYLAERLADPEYRAAYEAAAPVTGDDLPERRVWTCKIGGRVGRLSWGADLPMRRAVADAFTAETGRPVEFCFSGWGDDLDESELAVVEDRAPDPEAIRAALVKRLTALPPPEPPAPDDLVSRARGHAETHPESRELIEELIEELLETVVRWACFAAPSPVPSRPDGVLRDAANRLRWIANSGYIEDPGIKRIIRSWADELDATPAPPWPGAVLSGCVDEDGEPTWLAQAGQVRGEQVRRRSDLVWVNNDQMVAFPDTVWVEVRAPRAVPEPETERVGVWDALMNERTAVGYDGTPMKLRRGQTILYTRVDGGGGRLMYDDASHPEDKRPLVAPDGTVEVLARDGDQ